MDIPLHLQHEYHTKGILALAKRAGEDPHIFKALFKLYLTGEETLKRRSAWALGHVAVLKPERFKNSCDGLLQQLECKGQHQSIYRCAFKCLQEISVPETHLARVFDISCRYLSSEMYEAAVRAFAITVACKCAMPYPELRNELTAVLQSIQFESQSPAIRVRVRKALKDMAW